MANICEFKGKIVAEKKENIDQLAKWFKATYKVIARKPTVSIVG